MTEEEREKLIQAYYTVGVNEPELELRRSALDRMAKLVRQRSPKTVDHMERAKGLKRA